ncbi:MAG: MarR family transcriptional regulator [Sphingomonadales bacterium]|nr:MarR family transcriptional regulator [Sphingomonadales bacterium]
MHACQEEKPHISNMSERLQLSLLLSHVVSRQAVILDAAFRENGIPFTAEQYRLMYILCGQPGAHQEFYARKLGRDRSSLTRMLQPLERSGLLRRVQSENDRRSLHVEPTEIGADWVRQARPVADEVMRKLWEGIAAEERELLNSLLVRLRGNY